MRTVIIPVYKNFESLPALLAELDCLCAMSDEITEIVFVVDGSPDQSFEYLRGALPITGLHYQLHLLSRNYGSFSAIMAGLDRAQGDKIAVVAADLQEPIECVNQMLEKLSNDSADVVVARRRSRRDGLLTSLSSSVFWGIYRYLINSQVPAGGVDIFAVNRKAAKAVLALRESNSSLVGLLFWVGFRRDTVDYDRRKRESGRSAWAFRRKLKYLSDSLFSFTDLPIRVLLALGILGTVSAAGLGLWIYTLKILGRIDVPGYAAIALLVIFFGSLNITGTSLVGSYVWRAYENTKGRPAYLFLESISSDRGLGA